MKDKAIGTGRSDRNIRKSDENYIESMSKLEDNLMKLNTPNIKNYILL